MKNIDLLKAYFSPRPKGAPSLGYLEGKLQPGGENKKQKRNVFWGIGAIAVIAATIFLFRKAIPTIGDYFSPTMSDLPPEIQFFVLAIIIPALALSLSAGVYRLSKKFLERRALEVYIHRISQAPKMMVYVYGSGAKGFTEAVNRLSRGGLFKELVIFAHPSTAVAKRGYVRVMGALTACAPVQFAMGNHMAALEARAAEGRVCDEGHAVFMDAVGAQKTGVEWSVIHTGEGHTSVTCHTEWEDRRTTMNNFANPGRFVVVVRDASEQFTEQEDRYGDDDSHEKEINDQFDQSNIVSDTVVRIANGPKVGSGVVIDSDGLILTAAHVVGASDSVEIELGNGTYFEAEPVHRDLDADVALLRVHGVGGLNFIRPSEPGLLIAGDRVAAFGYPADSTNRDRPDIATGDIIDVGSDGPHTVISTDAVVVPGCSGGPLVTQDGRFVGMIMSRTTESIENKDIAFALSSRDVLRVVDDYEENARASAVSDYQADIEEIPVTANHKGEWSING